MREAVYETLSSEERAEFDQLVADREFDDDTFRGYHERTTDEHINRSEAEPFRWGPAFNEAVYGIMWGPSEFVLAETARLRDWSVTDRVEEIRCPTLVLHGEHDEISPALGREMAERIPNARFVEIEDASHLPLWEQPDEHVELVSEFFDSVAQGV